MIKDLSLVPNFCCQEVVVTNLKTGVTESLELQIDGENVSITSVSEHFSKQISNIEKELERCSDFKKYVRKF